MQAFKLNWRRPAGVIHPLILHSTTVILVAEYDTGYSHLQVRTSSRQGARRGMEARVWCGECIYVVYGCKYSIIICVHSIICVMAVQGMHSGVIYSMTIWCFLPSTLLHLWPSGAASVLGCHIHYTNINTIYILHIYSIYIYI